MILGIETATEVCSAALIHNGAVVSERSLNEKNIHSERLLMLIDKVLVDGQVSVKNLDAVAVSHGPGSFTGLRIGLSTAKGLALSCNTVLIAVPTLDGIAESFRLQTKKNSAQKFYALIDAKRNEAFFALYSITAADIHRESEFSIGVKDEILRNAQSLNAVVDQPAVNAASVALLAERRRKEFEVSDFSYLEPLYLRDFVATTSKK